MILQTFGRRSGFNAVDFSSCSLGALEKNSCRVSFSVLSCNPLSPNKLPRFKLPFFSLSFFPVEVPLALGEGSFILDFLSSDGAAAASPSASSPPPPPAAVCDGEASAASAGGASSFSEKVQMIEKFSMAPKH